MGTVVTRGHNQSGVHWMPVGGVYGGSGDAGDQYVGLERFGRAAGWQWFDENGNAASRAAWWEYGYDRNSNRLWRDDLVNAAFGELYAYDGLNQLTNFARGTLNGTHTGLIGAATRSQAWTIDGAGNFEEIGDTDVAETRSHNRQDQITALDSATPTYDANGNLTFDGYDTYQYDTWNRLVYMDTQSETTFRYDYDALGRRITEGPWFVLPVDPHHLYYNNAWQVVLDFHPGPTIARFTHL